MEQHFLSVCYNISEMLITHARPSVAASIIHHVHPQSPPLPTISIWREHCHDRGFICTSYAGKVYLKVHLMLIGASTGRFLGACKFRFSIPSTQQKGQKDKTHTLKIISN